MRGAGAASTSAPHPFAAQEQLAAGEDIARCPSCSLLIRVLRDDIQKTSPALAATGEGEGAVGASDAVDDPARRDPDGAAGVRNDGSEETLPVDGLQKLSVRDSADDADQPGSVIRAPPR